MTGLLWGFTYSGLLEQVPSYDLKYVLMVTLAELLLYFNTAEQILCFGLKSNQFMKVTRGAPSHLVISVT